MSATGSEAPTGGAPENPLPFVESDEQRTRFTYDDGGLPFYVAVVWAGLIVAYITVMAVLALPDLRAWLGR